MKYFFILGTNPTLSIAEISAIFGLNSKETKPPMGSLVSGDVLILETDEFDAKEALKKLGGVIKIGIIENETEENNPRNGGTDKQIQKIINQITDKKEKAGKFKFGISFYGSGKLNPKVLGMETKKHLREQNVSCRWVTSKEKTLSSVVVEQNKLTSKGIEIVLIKNHLGKILIGQTLAVQPFKDLSYRDYSRPARDDKSGMLPPKLAQIMINLTNRPSCQEGARRDHVLLDPFCGSGTILTEAMLMGYKNLIGSDISKKAIADTKENIGWIQDNYQSSIINLQLFNISATEISKKIKKNSVDAIVTEPYLGPQRGKIEFKKVAKELEELYSKTISEFEKVLKPNGTVVMLFPVFYNKYFISPKLGKFKITNPIPKNIRDNKKIKLTTRQTIIYGRKGQKVWREIVILKK